MSVFGKRLSAYLVSFLFGIPFLPCFFSRALFLLMFGVVPGAAPPPVPLSSVSGDGILRGTWSQKIVCSRTCFPEDKTRQECPINQIYIA